MSRVAWVAAHSEEEAKADACERFQLPDKNAVVVQQDEDVLDTWFSSGLFPFSVFGWPKETEEFKAFFPTTLLETGTIIRGAHTPQIVQLSFVFLLFVFFF